MQKESEIVEVIVYASEQYDETVERLEAANARNATGEILDRLNIKAHELYDVIGYLMQAMDKYGAKTVSTERAEATSLLTVFLIFSEIRHLPRGQKIWRDSSASAPFGSICLRLKSERFTRVGFSPTPSRRPSGNSEELW
jgi:hypothetical protein